jgi:hypothetical protein
LFRSHILKLYFRKNIALLIIHFVHVTNNLIFLKKLSIKQFNYKFSLTLSLPKRQHIFNFFNFMTNKYSVLTTGVLFKQYLTVAQFYKKQLEATTALVLLLKRFLFFKYSTFFYIFIYNLNFRQYVFFSKFLELIAPSIFLLLVKKPHILRLKYKKRIKRRVLRLLP